MKQLKTIENLKGIFPKVEGIEVALLYGSFGRNQGNPNSDIDIQILVDKNFQIQKLIGILNKKFEDEIQYISEVDLRNKVVVYFKSKPKVEFAICKSVDEINRSYLGSEIAVKNVKNTILFTNDKWKNNIGTYLEEAIKQDNKAKQHNAEKLVLQLVDKFVYEFESCSTMHRRCDAYRFYYFYNIAFHVAVRLNHLSKGEAKYNFLPKNFVAETLTAEEEKKSFYDLKGSLCLSEANKQKRKLLDFFYSSIIQTLISKEKQEELKLFLEWIFERDFFWNFRDISTHNPKIKSGIVYRSATLSRFEKKDIEKLLNEMQVKTVVDLRADKEIEAHPYDKETQNKFNYIRVPFDPWNQPKWFKEKHRHGTAEEIAYRFFGIGCNDKIKSALEAIINEENATVVHCYAGKDRTGIFISLLHLLVETPLETIYNDYLASEVDVKPYRLEMVLNIVNEKGGIVPYLIGCGLRRTQIQRLRKKLLNEQ